MPECEARFKALCDKCGQPATQGADDGTLYCQECWGRRNA
jgi:uncharacterized Zn finger protein (UPF0148 family)